MDKTKISLEMNLAQFYFLVCLYLVIEDEDIAVEDLVELGRMREKLDNECVKLGYKDALDFKNRALGEILFRKIKDVKDHRNSR